MPYNLDWSLLGPPVDVGGAIQRGFETGATRSALARLATNPTDEAALSRLAMFQPQTAIQMRDRARTEQFRDRVRSAFDPVTGRIDPTVMRSALAERGDIGDIVSFERQQTTSAEAQREADDAKRRRIADLLDDSNDPESYARNRQLAIAQLGADPAAIPEQFDPAWVETQRRLFAVLGDPQEMTSFQQDAVAAGIRPGTREFVELFRNRYAPPMQAVDVTGPDGSVTRQYIQRPQAGQGAPPVLTDEEVEALERGGPASGAPGTFPGN